jgi:hypothetical protein
MPYSKAAFLCKTEKNLNNNLSDRDLAVKIAALVERGDLDPGEPAYGVALAAIDLGYDRLTRAQRGLYDRLVTPALSALAEGREPRRAPLAREGADAWRPIRTAPDDRLVQLATMVDGRPSALAFACRQVQKTWVNADTGKPVFVRPSHWRDWPAA